MNSESKTHDLTEQLTKLGKLHADGALSDKEFVTLKARLISQINENINPGKVIYPSVADKTAAQSQAAIQLHQWSTKNRAWVLGGSLICVGMVLFCLLSYFGVNLLSLKPALRASCDDQAVIDAFLDQYLCGKEGEEVGSYCSSFNISGYKELKSLSDEELRRRVEKWWNTQEDPDHLTVNGLPINGPGAAEFLDFTKSALINATMSRRTWISSMTVVSTDYNPNIKRYTCRANIQFDNASLYNGCMLGEALAAGQDPRFKIFLQSSSGVNTLIGLLKSHASICMNTIKKPVTYTVQPKNLNDLFGSNFVVRLNDADAVQ